MSDRVNSIETPFAPGFGASAEAAMPVHVAQPTPPAGVEAVRERRSWQRVALRVLRNAAIAVGLMTMVPIGVVALRGSQIWGDGNGGGNTHVRMAQMERVRPFGLAPDPSITPAQAGIAFAALQGPPKNPTDYALREPASRPKASWRDVTLTPDMFVRANNRLYNGPSSQLILEEVARGFTLKETEFLKTLATAPVWREFDIVARAPAADMIGGRFQTPFAPGLSVEEMPLGDFKSTKELAYAAVSRAAYHMSIGQRDSAETILRSIVSFGVSVADNGTTLIDALIGNVIVGIGRDALQRFYTISHDPRAGSPALAPPSKLDLAGSARTRSPLPPLEDVRKRLIARALDPSVQRAERFEVLYSLAKSSCTNVPELLFGQRDDVRDAIAKARRELARYPSEQAVVDLIGRMPQPHTDLMKVDPFEALAVSAGTVAGTVLRNPRLATCARLASPYYRMY